MSPAMAITLAVHAIMAVLLGLHVARLRFTRRVGIGDGKDRVLRRAIRVHGNFAEWVPFALLALLAADLRGASESWIMGLGVALFVARCGHILGLSRSIGPSIGRSGGVALTALVTVIAAVLALFGS